MNSPHDDILAYLLAADKESQIKVVWWRDCHWMCLCSNPSSLQSKQRGHLKPAKLAHKITIAALSDLSVVSAEWHPFDLS